MKNSSLPSSSILIRCWLITFSIVLFVSHPAATAEELLTPEESTFVEHYITATNSGNPNDLLALLHPKNRECITEQNQDFYEAVLKRLVIVPIPSQVRQRVEKVENKILLGRIAFAMGPGSTLPISPTKSVVLQFDYHDSRSKEGCRKFTPNAATTALRIIDLAPEGENVRFVLGCVGQKGIEQFREKPARDAARAEENKKFRANMSPEFHAKMVDEIEGGRWFAAVKTCAETLKIPKSKAKDVLDLICDEMPISARASP